MIDKLARVGVALTLPIAMFGESFSTAVEMGFQGGNQFIAALANLGGPLGTIGGLSMLVIVTVLGDILIKIGMEEMLVVIYVLHRYKGRASSRVRAEVNKLWVSYEMRKRVLARIGC